MRSAAALGGYAALWARITNRHTCLIHKDLLPLLQTSQSQPPILFLDTLALHPYRFHCTLKHAGRAARHVQREHSPTCPWRGAAMHATGPRSTPLHGWAALERTPPPAQVLAAQPFTAGLQQHRVPSPRPHAYKPRSPRQRRQRDCTLEGARDGGGGQASSAVRAWEGHAFGGYCMGHGALHGARSHDDCCMNLLPSHWVPACRHATTRAFCRGAACAV